jgi:hypothetical protein
VVVENKERLVRDSMGDVLTAIDNFSSMISGIHIGVETIGCFSLTLVMLFVVRTIMLLKMEITGYKKTKNKLYIIGHICIEAAIGFIIGYLIMVLISSEVRNMFLDYIIAPLLGFLAGVFIDNKFFIPLEEKSHLGTYKTKEELPKAIESNNTVSDSTQVTSLHTKSKNTDKVNHLDDEIADSDNFNLLVIRAINELKDIQYDHKNNIETNSNKLDEALSILYKLKENEIQNKRLELKDLIYRCLNQGYATPAENDKVTMIYNAYIEFDDFDINEDITTLYHNHYLKLGVHEDRRVTDRGCTYGEFDHNH